MLRPQIPPPLMHQQEKIGYQIPTDDDRKVIYIKQKKKNNEHKSVKPIHCYVKNLNDFGRACGPYTP